MMIMIMKWVIDLPDLHIWAALKKAWQKSYGFEEMIQFMILEPQAAESGLNMTKY